MPSQTEPRMPWVPPDADQSNVGLRDGQVISRAVLERACALLSELRRYRPIPYGVTDEGKPLFVDWKMMLSELRRVADDSEATLSPTVIDVMCQAAICDNRGVVFAGVLDVVRCSDGKPDLELDPELLIDIDG